MPHTKMLDRAKIDLMDPNTRTRGADACPVFYSSILFALKHVFTDKVPTAGVDGYSLFINSVFFISLTIGQRVFLLAHECLHIAFRHIDSFKDFNLKVFSPAIEQMLWNMAGDHVINLALIRAGYEPISGILADSSFRNMSTLQVYKILHDEYTQNPSKFPQAAGDIIYPSDDGSAKASRDLGKLKNHVTQVVAKAKISSEMGGEGIGHLPGEIGRKLDEILNPRLPFEIILANYMSVYAKDDYTYSRPNRRFLPDVYLPGVHSPHLCNIASAFDVSGSVSRAELGSFGGGMRIIQEMLRPEKITLIEFDTKIRGMREVTPDTRIEDIEFHGGGGTDVKPVFEWANKNNPEVILIFTDGGFRMPSVTVSSDIIWIIHGNPNWTASNGKVFHYQLKR